MSVKNKKALIRILESENFMEESINRAASKFKISSRQVKNVYKDRALLAVTKSGKRRQEGGGRKLDDWWEQISPHVEEIFIKYRQEYNLQVTTKHLIWAQEACILKGIDLKRIAQKKGIKNLKAALMSRIYRFTKRSRITKRKINRANHVNEEEIGHRCARYMRNNRRLRDSLNIGVSWQECIDEVRVFESHLTEHSQTLEFVGAKDVSVRKMANPKAAHSLVIYTKSSANELMACLITRKAIPPEYTLEKL